MGKKFGVNEKKQAAYEKKAEEKKSKRDKERRAKEDAKWKDEVSEAAFKKRADEERAKAAAVAEKAAIRDELAKEEAAFE